MWHKMPSRIVPPNNSLELHFLHGKGPITLSQGNVLCSSRLTTSGSLPFYYHDRRKMFQFPIPD